MRRPRLTEHAHGFSWGSACVERVTSGDFGVVVRVWGVDPHGKPTRFVDVRVSPAGRVVEVLK